MRVLHLLKSNKYSGAENVVLTIMDACPDIEMIYASTDGPIRKVVEDRGHRFYPLEETSVRMVKKVVGELQPDIIHAHDFTMASTAAWAAGDIPVIAHLHNNPPWLKNVGVKSIVFALALPKIRQVISVSKAVEDEYIFRGLMKNKNTVIGNVVDAEDVRQKAREKSDCKPVDLVYLGRMSLPKNPLEFCKIVCEVKRLFPNITARMIGDGELMPQVKEYICSHELEDIIELVGFQSNPYPYLNAGKIMVMLYLVCFKPTGSESDIITLAYINTLANNVPALIATVWIFATILRGMWPRFRAFTWNATQEVLGTGGALFYLQIIIMVLFNVKELYISWFVGAEAVVDYQVYYKLIGMIGGLFSLALNPVWSAVTKALVEKKEQWIRGLYRKGIGLIALFGLAQLVLVAVMPMVVKIWLGENAIEVSRVAGLLFCVYNLVYMWMMLNYNFACGMGRTKVISIWLTVAGAGNLLLTMWGCSVYRSWITVVVATAVAAIPCAFFVQKDIFGVIKSMNSEKEGN